MEATKAITPHFDLKNLFAPKYVVCAILLLYNVLGITVMGFNRSFTQVAITAIAAMALQVFFDRIFNKKIVFPLSALTTSFGLSILLNYGHNNVLPLVSVYLAIASKFFFTFKGKHTFNPGLMGVVLSLLITNELISPAPAYQWNGIASMSTLIAIPALLLFMPRINRHYLVGSFLIVFTIQLILRSLIIKHYLPFNTLFFGTITSPPFFLFVFFMITDPATTPSDKKQQIWAGIWLALLDLFFHLFQSYHTFFYAALAFGTFKITKNHLREFIKEGPKYLKISFIDSQYYKRFFLIIIIALSGTLFYKFGLQDAASLYKPDFRLEQIDTTKIGMSFDKGEIFEAVDPRVQHMGKWILAISDGVAIADVDNDGLIDLFLTNGHKAKSQRNILFKNLGDFKFKRIESKELSLFASDYKKYGVPSNAMFVDFDNDGDKDLFITYAFGEQGSSRLFINSLSQTGKVDFTESTKTFGIYKYTNSATANFFDYNKDGLLDLVVGNTIATHLPDYKEKTKLDFFALPEPKHEGDERMFNFMHDSWHMARNGAPNSIYINQGSTFKELDLKELGIYDTRWTMAIATADFNKDGWTDLYYANDFGPDNFYLNKQGRGFQNIKGNYFGEIGKDTYKGMNATIADFDRNGMMDVYISNVHHPLQAEGSLLWSFHKNKDNNFVPKVKDQASYLGLLNENRFGWGASAKDFNNDGHVDLVQANGMVDDIWDRKSEQCPDYWYINEKIARSPPAIHRYINKWGDIRGTCIHGKEKNRMYINRGPSKRPQFIDIASSVGMDQVGNWRGMAAGDFNNDGKMDLVVSSLYRNPLVFKNTANTHKNSWIGFDLKSNDKSCNSQAIGSRITIIYDNDQSSQLKQTIETTLVNGFSAQHDTRAHFGLGQNPKIKSLEVNWCLSKKKTYKNISINKYNKLTL